MTLQPVFLPTEQLFHCKLFRIPEYQRTYSWEKKQRLALFNDIQKLALKLQENKNNNNCYHLMATIVCLKIDNKEKIRGKQFDVYSVVDGQQRLTTLVILLKAIQKALLSGNEGDKDHATELNKLLVKENGRLILLQTNHDNKSLLRNYLESGSIPDEQNAATQADKNMISAFKECENFVAEFCNEEKVDVGLKKEAIDLLEIIQYHLKFIFHVEEDEGSVHNTFEVLNSRGLEVDSLDKCKSMLMKIGFEKFDESASKEHIKELHETWSDIYRTIGLKKIAGQEILKFAATLKESNSQSKIISAEQAMDFFRTQSEEDPLKVIKISEYFLKIAAELEKMSQNFRLKAVTKISHARLLAIAILLHDKLSDEQKQNLLKEWEKVTFKIFGIFRKDSRSKVGDYVRLSKEIYNNLDMPYETMIEKIISIGKEHSIDDAVKGLENQNCYDGWEDELIYFFYRYEEHLSKEQGFSISKEIWEQIWISSHTKTIEHIHPQTMNDSWKTKLGTKQNYINKQVHRLGNLIILPPGINSRASNKSFQKKKEIYEQHTSLRLIREVIQEEDWNAEALDNREKRLIEWAKEEWK